MGNRFIDTDFDWFESPESRFYEVHGKPESTKKAFDPNQPRDEDGKWTDTGGKLSETQLIEMYQKGIVPPGYYVHGRAGREDLDTGHVIQLTNNLDTAEFYGRSGSVWMIRPQDTATVIDFSDENSDDWPKVEKLFRASHQRGTFPDHSYGGLPSDEDKAWGLVKSSFLVENIVNSAEGFDDYRIVNWLTEETEADFIKVPEGAVVLNLDGVEAIKVRGKVNKAFDPNQPRNPAGSPDGGQWTGEVELAPKLRARRVGHYEGEWPPEMAEDEYAWSEEDQAWVYHNGEEGWVLEESHGDADDDPYIVYGREQGISATPGTITRLPGGKRVSHEEALSAVIEGKQEYWSEDEARTMFSRALLSDDDARDQIEEETGIIVRGGRKLRFEKKP